MIAITNEKKKMDIVLFEYLPPVIRALTARLPVSQLEEIRLRLGLPLSVHLQSGTYFISRRGSLIKEPDTAYITTQSDITSALELISRGSMYSLENEIRQGYITVAGGHRIGLAGKAVLNGRLVTYLKDVSGLNYRFAKEIIGAADAVVADVCCKDPPPSTLVISPPQCGKTTLLRDLSRHLSYRGYKVCIVDERCEIAGMVQGVSSFDLGPHTDVLDACPKADGMLMALRSMSPQVLITDEIGTNEDYIAIHTALSCGVSVMASIHAANRNDLVTKPGFEQISKLFDRIVTLSKRLGSGTVEEIYNLKKSSQPAVKMAGL